MNLEDERRTIKEDTMKEDFDINEWLKRVSTISTETVSQYIKGDYLTKLKINYDIKRIY